MKVGCKIKSKIGCIKATKQGGQLKAPSGCNSQGDFFSINGNCTQPCDLRMACSTCTTDGLCSWCVADQTCYSGDQGGCLSDGASCPPEGGIIFAFFNTVF